MSALDDLIRAVEAAGRYRMPRASDMPSALRPVGSITTNYTTPLTPLPPETVSAAGTGAFLRAVQAKQQDGTP